MEINAPIFIDQQLHGDFDEEISMQGPFDVQVSATMGYPIPFRPQQIYKTDIKLVNNGCQQLYQKSLRQLADADRNAVPGIGETAQYPISDRSDRYQGRTRLSSLIKFGRI